MLPFLSINVGHSFRVTRLPISILAILSKNAKSNRGRQELPECLNKRFQYLNFRAKNGNFGNFEPNIYIIQIFLRIFASKGKQNPITFYNFYSKSTILARKFKHLLDFTISN